MELLIKIVISDKKINEIFRDEIGELPNSRDRHYVKQALIKEIEFMFSRGLKKDLIRVSEDFIERFVKKEKGLSLTGRY